MTKLSAFVLLSLGLCFAPSAQAAFVFSATLQGSQEVPPNASTASGLATLVLNEAQTRLTMNIQIFGLDLDGSQTPGDPNDNVTGLHIHFGAVGVNGPVVFGLIGPNHDLNNDLMINAVAGTVFSAWDLNEGNPNLPTTLADQLSNLFNGDLYLNVHTPVFPGGEIRGQILLQQQAEVPEPSTLASWLLLTLAAGAVLRRRIARPPG